MYQPIPIDTTRIEIPNSLRSLIEQMAQDIHNLWAAKRISEGWTYGTCRDDLHKTHPCIVPYKKLTDQEKNYDREIVRKVIKLILYHGFTIQ